jgi:hypothetical protein
MTPPPPRPSSALLAEASALRAALQDMDAVTGDYCLALALGEKHEAGRTEMSDAIAGLLERHCGVPPTFGWEARILSLALDHRRAIRLLTEERDALRIEVAGLRVGAPVIPVLSPAPVDADLEGPILFETPLPSSE